MASSSVPNVASRVVCAHATPIVENSSRPHKCPQSREVASPHATLKTRRHILTAVPLTFASFIAFPTTHSSSHCGRRIFYDRGSCTRGMVVIAAPQPSYPHIAASPKLLSLDVYEDSLKSASVNYGLLPTYDCARAT
eukprot:4930112-Pyramimonas_sp.AAC.2